MTKIQVLFAMMVVAGSASLTTLVDDGLGIGWTHDVVRNWEQWGFFNLHGKLVMNPGGFQANTDPRTYSGHRPLSLYPYFLTQKLLPAAAAARFYYALVAAVVFAGIWQLLGRTNWAFWLGIFSILSPGYLVWQTILDPNLAAAVAGFPFCAAVFWLLQREKLSAMSIAALLGLVLSYTAINWSTAFIHAMLFVALWLLPEMPRRRIILYTGLAALSALMVVGFSLLDKMREATSGSDGPGGLSLMLRSYCWGNAGYGLDLSTKTAFLRLLVVNGIGLLPVIAWLAWGWWQSRKDHRDIRFLLPLLVAILEVAVLRNYFGHHPWMSCHFILLGMILSFVVWRSTGPTDTVGVPVLPKPRWRGAGFCLALAYGFLVLFFYHVHNGRQLAVLKLIRDHTLRSAVILIARDTDPGLADLEPRLPELFDRRVEVVEQITKLDREPVENFWLTAETNRSFQLVGRTAGMDDNGGPPLIGQMLQWYSRSIAHRRAGDKLDFGENYYVYH